MRKSTIKDIFSGLKGNKESMSIPKEVIKNLSEICKFYDELKEKLSPELLEPHQKYVGALEKNWCDEVDFYFTEGFKLGLLAGIESMES